MKKNIFFLFTVLPIIAFAQLKKVLPIIDMHIHANRADFAGPPPLTMCIHNEEWPVTSRGDQWGDSLSAYLKNCNHPIISGKTDDEIMNRTIAIMNRRNIIGVASGRLVNNWHSAAPNRIIPSHILRMNGTDPSPDSLRRLFTSKQFLVMGEIEAQYNGIKADDSILEPYWQLAEELNIPVGIHIGPGPIGARYIMWDKYKANMHSPLQIEGVLAKHPNLRVYIMHAAWPMKDELLSILWNYPQIYVDISGILTDLNSRAFYSYLRSIVEAGFVKRVMFGSDQMIWPELIEEGIKTIEKADFITQGQKRDILYNNAARFFTI